MSCHSQFWLEVPIKEATSRHDYIAVDREVKHKIEVSKRPQITYTCIIVHYFGWHLYSQDNTHIDQNATNRRILCKNYTYNSLIIRMTQNVASFIFLFQSRLHAICICICAFKRRQFPRQSHLIIVSLWR